MRRILLATGALVAVMAACADDPKPGDCRTSNDCPDEYTCLSFECRLTCNTPSDCLEPKDECVAGVCLPADIVGETCSETNPEGSCSTGRTCLAGACTATSSLCSASNTTGLCAGSETCVDGTCRTPAELCSATNHTGHCAGSDTCIDGTCRTSAELCSASNQTGHCASSHTCIDGTCRIPADLCSASNQTGYCAGGDTCIDGTCRASAELCAETNRTGYCAGGATCIDGTCRTEAELCSESNPSGVCVAPASCVARKCHTQIVFLDFEDADAGNSYDVQFATGLETHADWAYSPTIANGAGWAVDGQNALRYPTLSESGMGFDHSLFRAGIRIDEAWLVQQDLLDTCRVDFAIRIPEMGSVMTYTSGHDYFWASAIWSWYTDVGPEQHLFVAFDDATTLGIWNYAGSWNASQRPVATADITGHVSPNTVYHVAVTWQRHATSGSVTVDWDGVTFDMAGDTELDNATKMTIFNMGGGGASDNDTRYFGAIDQITLWRPE